MGRLKKSIAQMPGLRQLAELVHRRREAKALRGQAAQDVFTRIFRENQWGCDESRSGSGSDLEQTQVIRAELPQLCRELGIRSILDSPCGDFHWMKEVDLDGVAYTGADIVSELVEQNRRFAGAGVDFRRLNLLTDELPRADLVLCRDCLVHLSFEDIGAALRNIRRSGATWLLTTTFPHAAANEDIATGQWRVLNLQAEPFGFPAPLRMIREGCTSGGGRYEDKSLGLWRVDGIDGWLKTA